MHIIFLASWRRFRYDRKCLFLCIYNPQITISPSSLFSVNFNGNCVKNYPKPLTCPLKTYLFLIYFHFLIWLNLKLLTHLSVILVVTLHTETPWTLRVFFLSFFPLSPLSFCFCFCHFENSHKILFQKLKQDWCFTISRIMLVKTAIKYYCINNMIWL